MTSNNNGGAKIAYFKNNLKKRKIKYSNLKYKDNTYYYCGEKDYYIFSYSNRNKSIVAIILIKNN